MGYLRWVDIFVCVASTLAIQSLAFSWTARADLPAGFVYLRDVDPSIIQEMRYAGKHNFIGRPVEGYEAEECILTRPAAEALRLVQTRLASRRLSLKVYDCYRPDRAVKAFAAWAKDPKDQLAKAEFYPTLQKSDLHAQKYIAKRSAHSRGSAVDLTIVPLPEPKQETYDLRHQRPCHLPVGRRFKDSSLDFGTGYDCFHPLSHTHATAIDGKARENRRLLVEAMKQTGFDNYRREWWHFELRNEPFPRSFFDFPIVSKSAKPDKLLSRSLPSAYRIACGQAVGVYSGPSIGHDRVGQFGATTELLVFSCEGDLTIEQWNSLDPIGRLSVRAPWCLVEARSTGGSSLPLRGWIDGEALAPQLGDGDSGTLCR